VPLDAALANRVRALTSGGRVLLGLTGAPGAGKSTVSDWLLEELGDEAVVVPMDGFHLHDDELARLGRSDRKGAPDTFDVGGYVALLERVRADDGSTVYAPEFVREREESVAGAIAVRPEHRLVVTEGNYLLLEQDGWSGVRRLLDEVWFLEPPEDLRLERLVARHVAHGRSHEEAVCWVARSDQANAALVATTRERADLVVELD
jgi:pantothenate kinase